MTSMLRVDPARREVWCSGNPAPLGYDALLVASGARARPPAFPGGHLPGVLTLRTIQDARRVVDTLVEKTFAAARWNGAKAVGIAGGVSANSGLRRAAQARGKAIEMPVLIPRVSLSTDNAAMIAAAGFRQLAAGRLATKDLNADASLAL